MDELDFGFAVKFRDAVSKQAATAARAIQNLWTEMKTAAETSRSAASKVSQTARAADGLGSAATRAAAALRLGNTRLGQWAARAQQAESATGVFGRAVQGLALFLGARMLVGAFTDAIKVGTEFEQQMTNTGSVMNTTGPELALLSERAKTLGASMGVSATAIAEGMFILGQAGLNTKKVLDTIEPSLHMAGVGAISMEKSTEVLVSTLGQFQLGTDQATRVANTFSAAANASQASISRLAAGMEAAGPVAASFGRNLEETSAAIGVLSQVGIQGGEAGTHLRNIMASTQNPSKNLTIALDALGIKMSDLDLKTHSLNDVMNKLAPLAARNDLVFKLFGRHSAPAFLAFTNQGKDSIDKMLKSMGEQSSAAVVYAQRMNTVAGAQKLAAASLESFKLAIFDIIKPFRLQFLQTLAGFWTRFREFILAAKPLIDQLFRTFFAVLNVGREALAKWFGGVGSIFNRVIEAGRTSREALQNVLGPLILGLEIIKVDLVDFFRGFIEGFSNGLKVAKAALLPVLGLLAWLGERLLDLGGLVDAQGNRWRGLGTIIGTVLALVASFKIARWGLMIPVSAVQSWVAWGAAALNAGKAVMSAVTGSSLFAAMLGRLRVAVLALQLSAFALGTTIAALLGAFALLVVAGVLLYKNWDEITFFFKFVWNETVLALKAGWDWFTSAFSTGIAIFQNLWGTLRDYIVGAGLYVALALVKAWTWLKDTATSIFTSIWGFVVDGAKFVWSALVTLFTSIGQVVASVFNYIMELPLFKWLGEKVTSAVNLVKNAFGTFINFLANLSLPEWLNRIIDWLASGDMAKGAAEFRKGASGALSAELGMTSVAPAPPSAPASPFAAPGASLQAPSAPGASPALPSALGSLTTTLPDLPASPQSATSSQVFQNTFAPGSINISADGVKDVDAFARRLYPALQRVAMEQNSRGRAGRAL